jgi:hypothetical protein
MNNVILSEAKHALPVLAPVRTGQGGAPSRPGPAFAICYGLQIA